MLISTSLRSMLGRRGNVLGALIAHALSVAIMFGTLLVLMSTFNGPGAAVRLNAADVVVEPDLQDVFDAPADSIPQGVTIRIPPDTAVAIEGIEGVDHVVRDVTFAAQALNDDGTPISVSDMAAPRGQSWESAQLTPFVIREGRPPQRTNEIAIDAGIAKAGNLAIGDDVPVVTNRSISHYTIVGIAVPENATLPERQSSMFFAPATATALSGSAGSADLIGVFLNDGADLDTVRDQIQSVTEGQEIRVLVGSDRAKADVTAGATDVMELGIVLGIMAGFVGFVSIFVLASTFGFSIQQRAQEIGLQRAIGYTPKQVRRMVLVEAVAIAIAGSVPGLVFGALFARLFVRIAIWADKAPEGFTVSLSMLAAMIVLGTSFAISMLAAWMASRKTSRIRPIEALRSASAPKVWIGWARLSAGLALITGGVASVLLAASIPTDAAVAISLLVTMLLTIGCAILGAIVVLPFVRLVRPFIVLGESITGEIAASNASRMAARVASASTPVLLGVGFMTLMFGFTATIEKSAVVVSDERETADLYVVPAAAALPEDVIPHIDGVDGVESVGRMQSTTVVTTTEASSANVLAVDPSTLDTFTDLDFEKGGLDRFGPGTIIVNDALGIDGVFTYGATLDLMMEDGQQHTFTVVGTASNLIGSGDVLMAYEDAAPHITDSAPTIAIDVAGEADTETVRSRIESLVDDGMPVQVLTHEEYVAGIEQSMQEGIWATYLIIGGAAAFGMVAVVNTLTMATSERAREFALMRLIGATSGQIIRMLAKEAVIVSATGLALGWGIALLSTAPVSLGLAGDLSAMRMPVLPAIGTGLIGVIVIFGSTLIPGAMALRTSPMTEIGRKE